MPREPARRIQLRVEVMEPPLVEGTVIREEIEVRRGVWESVAADGRAMRLDLTTAADVVTSAENRTLDTRLPARGRQRLVLENAREDSDAVEGLVVSRDEQVLADDPWVPAPGAGGVERIPRSSIESVTVRQPKPERLVTGPKQETLLYGLLAAVAILLYAGAQFALESLSSEPPPEFVPE